MGLSNPMPGHTVTQGFTGSYRAEPSGWLSGTWRARSTAFLGALPRLHLHKALDVACPIGTSVLAPERAKLVLQAIDGPTGDHFAYLEIRPGTVLGFNHLSRVLIPVGSWVDRGKPFALSGATGHVTGPHLHWSVRHTTGADKDPRRSSSWFRYNPARLLVGGDKATTEWIKPV